MKSIKARIQGFAVLPLLVVVFLLAISALGTYIVVKQGTGGYGTRAGTDRSALSKVSRTLGDVTYNCSRVDCGKWVTSDTFTTENQGRICNSIKDKAGLSVCNWTNAQLTTPNCDVNKTNYRTRTTLYGLANMRLVEAVGEDSENIAYYDCTRSKKSPASMTCGTGKACCWTAESFGLKSTDAWFYKYSCTSGTPSSNNSSCTCGGKSLIPPPANNSCASVGANCCFRSQPNNTGYYCNSPYKCSTNTSDGKCISQDQKPVVSPDPGTGGGGGTIPQDSQCTNIGGTCTNVGTAQQCPDANKPRLLIGYCPSSPSTSVRCCAPASGGGGGTTNPPVTGSAPTCTLTGPTTMSTGSQTSFTATCTDADSNLNKIEIYTSPTSNATWSLFKTCDITPGGSGTCTGSVSINTAGSYYIVANGYDSTGLKCTGNPWTLPAGWTSCPTSKISATVGSGSSGTTGDATLAFKLKFQGVDGYPKGGKTVPFKVKLQGPTSTGYQSGTLTVNNQGVWEGNVSFTNIVVGSSTKYTVFVKVGKHLQKRVCASDPSETSGGTYNCSESNMPITSGTNNLDFSGILMLVGDLPSSTGEQNGVVDSYDISFVLNHLGSTVESELAIGDLNFDGVIDTQDRSLIIQSLNVKYDDQ